MAIDCDVSTKTKNRLLLVFAAVVVITIAVAVPLTVRRGKEEKASGSVGNVDEANTTSTGTSTSTTEEQQCLFAELEKLPLPSAMQGPNSLKPKDVLKPDGDVLPAVARMRVAPTIDAFVVKLDLKDSQDLVLMMKNVAGEWDEIVLEDAVRDSVTGWSLSADGNRLAYRHVPSSCPNDVFYCSGYKVVQINRGGGGITNTNTTVGGKGGVVTTVSEILSADDVMYDGLEINHDGTVGVSMWQGDTSSVTGFSQTDVAVHDLATGARIGGPRSVDELVLDVLVEAEGRRVSYYAHNPFDNVNRLDVVELDDATGQWVDVVDPHPTFVSIRFASPALLNDGRTVAYCKIDNDFNGELEFQELRRDDEEEDGGTTGLAWSILSDRAHGDLQDHACRGAEFSQDHTKVLLQFRNDEGDDYMGMFWLEEGVWTKKAVVKIPEKVLVSPFERGVAADNVLLAMDSSGSRMMVLVDDPHPDHTDSEQHLSHYAFGCNVSD